MYCKLKLFFGKRWVFCASKTKVCFKQSKCPRWADDKKNFWETSPQKLTWCLQLTCFTLVCGMVQLQFYKDSGNKQLLMQNEILTILVPCRRTEDRRPEKWGRRRLCQWILSWDGKRWASNWYWGEPTVMRSSIINCQLKTKRTKKTWSWTELVFGVTNSI